ncbi:MAG: hypothetical protein WAX48_10695 [Desulfosalsimonadaceae bacterium]
MGKNPATRDMEADWFKKYGIISTMHARTQLTHPHPIVGIEIQIRHNNWFFYTYWSFCLALTGFGGKGNTLSAGEAHRDAAQTRWFPWITGANCLSD